MDFTKLTIREINKNLKEKKFSASELAGFFIGEIEKKDKDIKAFLSNDFALAKKQAQGVDEKIKAGEEISMLAGVPAAIKDNILIQGMKATASSKMLENYVATYDATVIEKLKSLDTVFLGKTNMDEFAMGSSTENSAFFKTKPKDLSKVPGGSSGGSAAAVAAGEAVFALGSDTGGSIRQPASFCGVVGLKPTYGAVSRYGLIAMASSLDQIGPFAKTADDARVVFEAIKGKDKRDATSVNYLDRLQEKGLKGLKVGIPKEYFIDGMDKEVERLIKAEIKKMEDAGAKIEEISLPHTKSALSVYYILMPAEVSSNMARYDGIKYGFSTHGQNSGDLLSVYLNSRAEGLGAEVKRRIMLGTYVLSAGYYDAYYKRAQQVRTKITDDFKKAFEKVDIIATPTSPTTAFAFGEKTADPLSMYLADIFTVPINLAGVPAISIPCGDVKSMPVGLQLIAPWFYEETLFKAGEEYEAIR
ncbi:Asp-tRNA(Asn)/Glu-tRNA(Gln) amidotransferase subunit GatA [Candidatus Azambacteria bacterium]|nr:Asp-tRNA(Asn)/Glu-tRNA(Gln) amidotransferase subunit GatA [Candidatus Azambacteria bacterium]